MRGQKGLFVVFEGLDCSGKTTTLNLVDEGLNKRGWNTIGFKGVASNTEFGKKIKDKYSTFWFLVDLFLVTCRLIKPSLKIRRIILQDKYHYYLQTYWPNGLYIENQIWFWIFEKLACRPDLLIYFDVDNDVHRERLIHSTEGHANHYRLATEKDFLEIRKKIYDYVLARFEQRGGKVLRINTTHKAPAEVAIEVTKAIEALQEGVRHG